jgi:hypothetical protein
MGVAVPSPLPESLGQEPAAEGLDADMQPLPGELLAGQRGTEVRVTGSVGLEDLPTQGGVALVVGGLASQAVDQGGVATGLELALDASDLSDAPLEESGGLGLGPLAVENGLHHLEDVTLTLAHLDTVPVLYLDHLASPSA